MAATTGGRVRAQNAIDALELEGPVDQSAWSTQRIRAYASSAPVATAPLAVLRIPRLKLTVPILEGIDEPVLDRGVGHIPETASPGEPGNIAIAGHRDSFFRSLKDIRAGDEIELATRGTRDRYIVERTWIVDPEDLSVLEPTKAPSMTLVTCYPFYYVGSAPRRYIVRAVRAGREVR
jgi:sortase A